MNLACRNVVAAFAGLYVLALALFAIGTFGLSGSKSGPLAGIFLMPLGLPWNLFLGDLPSAALPWLAASAPLLNLLLVWILCRHTSTGQGTG